MINQEQLAKMLAERHNTLSPKKIDEILEMFKLLVSHSLRRGEAVTLTGFGKFEPFTRYARKAYHPQEHKIITVPETTVAKFRAGSNLKKLLKDKDEK